MSDEKPFVILGEVGRGKTSFLRYLQLVAASDNLKNYIQLTIDFIDRPDSPDQVPDFVYNEVERQLREDYQIDINEDKVARGILHPELQRLKKSPKGALLGKDAEKYALYEVDELEKLMRDKHAYIGKALNHLKRGRNKSLAIYFDNLDRRKEGIQEEAFLKSSAIARDWSSLVFICLRPSTFYKSKVEGVLDSIAPRAFTVGQPDLAVVLKRRFSYARDLAAGETDMTSWGSVPPSRDITFDLPGVAQILNSCIFAARKRHGIIPMLEAVSNGNIRALLDRTRAILTAGHLDTKKILSAIEKGGSYTIPDFEGVKTLLYGDYQHYDPSKSSFVNIFDTFHNDNREHFIRFAALAYLNRFAQSSPSRGYVSTADLNQYLASMGHYPEDISRTMSFLFDKKCVRGLIDGLEWSDGIRELRITTLGRYHINNLASSFQYLEAIIIDTPILDPNIRKKIFITFDLRDRVQNTKLMLEYLNKSESLNTDNILKEEWKERTAQILKQIDEIHDRRPETKQIASTTQ